VAITYARGRFQTGAPHSPVAGTRLMQWPPRALKWFKTPPDVSGCAHQSSTEACGLLVVSCSKTTFWDRGSREAHDFPYDNSICCTGEILLFHSRVVKKCVDADLNHMPTRASTLEVAHDLDRNKNAVNQQNRPANRLGLFDACSSPGRLLNTSYKRFVGRAQRGCPRVGKATENTAKSRQEM
jgi:hypothetical protein